ncbi:MAG: hypothetical protein LBK58_09410, partial [Prevotellaceae bacterium]|nr:hypothetical protein [Prevotellaceae bacterium]
FYLSGDDIWFKAYLVDAQTGTLSQNSSRILYAELISPESKILMRRILYVDSTGCSIGDFKLKENAVSGKYRIRAYTKWMLNFGDVFAFEKEIEVKNISGEPELTDTKKTRKNKKNSQSEKRTDFEDVEMEFFPESGSLIMNVENTVAFKAVDRSGKSREVSGGVFNSKGDTVALFASEYLGMGKFMFTPQKGENYYAFFMPEGIPYLFSVELPEAVSAGFVINITEHDTVFYMNIKTNAETLEKFQEKKIFLDFRHLENQLFSYEMVMETDSVTAFFPKSMLPAGITCITLYDESAKPYCERLVYVENRNRINVEIEPAGDTVSIIKLTDDKKQPVRAHLSMSIVSKAVPDENFDIETYFWLESEIKGKIEQPAAYFDTANANRFKNMNLLLLTQGWRDFVWKHVANDTTDFAGYYMEHGLQISGYVKRGKKPCINADIYMYFPHFGIDKGVGVTQTDSAGNYNFGQTDFWGEQSMFINFKSKKNKYAEEIFVNPLCMQAEHFPVKILEKYEIDNIYASPAENRKSDYKLTDTVVLDAVTITGKNRKEWFLFDMEPTLKDEKRWESLDFYVYGKLPGVLIKYDQVRYNFYNIYGEKMKNSVLPSKISLKEIEKVKIYKYKDQIIPISAEKELTRTVYIADVYARVNKFTKQHYSTMVMGPHGLIAIDSPEYNAFTPVLNGYYEKRKFYTPKFHSNADIKEYFGTYFWQADIRTGANGEGSVAYNPEKQPSGKIRIEGLTDDGIPFAVKLK